MYWGYFVLKYKEFTSKTTDKIDSERTSYADLRLRALADINKEINTEDIVSIKENIWTTEKRPSMADSRTWFTRKGITFKVYYKSNSNKEVDSGKMELLRSKLALFKMIAQFMYTGTEEDGTEYFDDYCESAGEAAFGILGFKSDRISKEEFYMEYDKLLSEMSKLDGVDRNWSFLDWYKKDKEERDNYKNNSLLLVAEETNWGEICSGVGEWLNTRYTIYKNGKFEIVKSFDEKKNNKSTSEEFEEVYSGRLLEEDLLILNSMLRDFFKEGEDLDGCDGTGWNITSYLNNKPEKYSGYIHSDLGIQTIVKLLHELQS